MAKLKKPKSVKSSKIKSDKWDEITKDRDFKESDIPTLTLLCQWHLVAETCISDMDEVDNQLVYTNNLDDIKAMPQLEIMKKASAEIRQLNKQLGICDTAKQPKQTNKTTILKMVVDDRARKAAGA